ncbi:MAG: phytanoyl-CoA dioxygenase family protein [Pseudomonadota bacterium]
MAGELKTDAYPDLERDLTFYPLGVDTPAVLTRDQIDQYNRDGYLAPFTIFSTDEMTGVRAYFDDLLERGMAAGWSNYDLTNWHKYCRGVWDLVTNQRILDIVSDLLGDTVILRHSHFFAKLPGDGKKVSWHQDASYWPLSKSRVVSAWLAIDDVDEGNSAMHVIPASHQRAQLAFADSWPPEENVLNQVVEDALSYGDPVPLTLKAGEISLHSDWILHGSEKNTSSRRRCGLAMRFLSGDVRAYLGWNQHSIVCRGTEATGHWANHPRPDGDSIPALGAITK